MFHNLATSFRTNSNLSNVHDLLVKFPHTNIDRHQSENIMCVVTWDDDNNWAKYIITLYPNNNLELNHTIGQSHIWVVVFHLLKSIFSIEKSSLTDLSTDLQIYTPLCRSIYTPPQVRIKTSKIELPPMLPIQMTFDPTFDLSFDLTFDPTLEQPVQLISQINDDKNEINGEYHKQICEMISSVYLETYTSGAVLYTRFVKNNLGVNPQEITALIKILLTEHFNPQCVRCAAGLSMFIGPEHIESTKKLFNHIVNLTQLSTYQDILLWKNPMQRVQMRLQQLNKNIV